MRRNVVRKTSFVQHTRIQHAKRTDARLPHGFDLDEIVDPRLCIVKGVLKDGRGGGCWTCADKVCRRTREETDGELGPDGQTDVIAVAPETSGGGACITSIKPKGLTGIAIKTIGIGQTPRGTGLTGAVKRQGAGIIGSNACDWW